MSQEALDAVRKLRERLRGIEVELRHLEYLVSPCGRSGHEWIEEWTGYYKCKKCGCEDWAIA